MTQLTIDLDQQSYPIVIRPHALDEKGLIESFVNGSQLVIVSNETVAPLYLSSLKAAIDSKQVQTIVLPDGEQYKNMESLMRIFDSLIQNQCHRDVTLLALGGGVIGDMTGFAAACYMRGVNFIQVPTTLLAQVDASVGGKTGINHFQAKNLIGSFHQPTAVIIDPLTLNSLPDREYRSGIAEILKYGLIQDRPFFDWMRANCQALMDRNPLILSEAIQRSCENKATIVAQDERETGLRALLNFGHTLGHAIETLTNYKHFLHGEAVSIGMCLAAKLSVTMGLCDRVIEQQIIDSLESYKLPTKIPAQLKAEEIVLLMRNDKKNLSGQLRMILLERIGAAKIVNLEDETLLLECLGCR